MGQPTHGVSQRVGKNQMWRHMAFFSLKETSYGENNLKLHLGLRLSTLFFLSLVFLPKTHLWLSALTAQRFFFNARGWQGHVRYFPRLVNDSIAQLKYFARKSATPLFKDGETTVFSLAYTHRTLRVGGLFWCQPRCFRLDSAVLVLLRACNVSCGQGRLRRSRSLRVSSVFKLFHARLCNQSTFVTGGDTWF